MSGKRKSRRKLLAGLAGAVGVSTLIPKAVAARVTPQAAEGPYYPEPSMRLPDIDNDLVKVADRVSEAGGTVLILRGRLMDQGGKPLTGHRIEIWQCDTNGNYMHPRDRRSVNFDDGFQGFGHDITDVDGGYVFRTIVPARYPGRTPHIHVKVLQGARELLTTQFYIAGERSNARDGLFSRMSADEAAAVSMDIIDSGQGAQTTVDIVI